MAGILAKATRGTAQRKTFLSHMKAAPEAIALKAKVKCKLLDALGQPGWGFKSYPRGDGTSTNVLFRHLVLTGKPISFAAAQKVAARG